MKKPVVLLVDDERAVVDGLRLRLRGRSFAVETATSAAQALERLTLGGVCAIVSDERMPGMSGSEFLAVVAKTHPDVVRVVLTGQASVEAAMRAINEARIHHFLSKPADSAALGDLLERLLLEREEKLEGTALPLTGAERFGVLLETLHPGITSVARDDSGAVLLDDEPLSEVS